MLLRCLVFAPLMLLCSCLYPAFYVGQQVRYDGKVWTVQEQVQSPDGQWRWIIMDAEGEDLCVAASRLQPVD